MPEFPHFQTETRQPSPAPPPESCDCQVHVFGDPVRYPGRRGRPYPPPDGADFAAVRRLHRTLGFERGVIVQSTVHGTDHRILYDALAGQPDYRGVALIDDTISDRELQRLHDAGVRGARFNFWKILNLVPSRASFERSIERIKPFGWHAKIHAVAEEWLELADLLRQVTIPIVIDHMAHLDVRQGVEQPVVRLLLDLLRRENWWILVSSGDRISTMTEAWDNVLPFAHKFIDAAPDRSIWCSDWPHVRYAKPAVPNDAELLELLYRFAPEPERRRQILVDNPARLFGFTRS